MSDVTRLIEAAQQGDRQAAGALLPLVYDELRRLASSRMAAESPGHTLDATALVHEAYLRLIGEQQFDGRGHFFAAAAEAMRRILVDAARKKMSAKRNGGRRTDLPELAAPNGASPDDLIDLDEQLTKLAFEDPDAALIVRLHFFAGLSLEQVGETLGISKSAAHRQWTYARAWLRMALKSPKIEKNSE